MKSRSLVLGVFLLVLSLIHGAGAQPPPPKAQNGEGDYLKAIELFHAKQYPETLAAADALLGTPAASQWHHKAVFLKAQAYVEMKKFKEASAIYEMEAKRLLSPSRKLELATVIVRFADKLTETPDPKVPDAPQPDYNKACSLYTKALGMEIARDLRDDILFKRARAYQQAKNPGQAIQEFQAYLTEFDPAWTGPAGSGSARLPMKNPPPAGKQVLSARRYLAESFLDSGNLAQARMEIEDLLKMTADPKGERAPGIPALRADLAWLQVGTYFMLTQPARADRLTSPTARTPLFTLRTGDLDQAVKTCRDYLAAYPEGSRALRTAWMIPEGFDAAGRADDAVIAYRDFIDCKGFRLSATPAVIDTEVGATPAETLAEMKMLALFRIGQILAGQKKYADAIAAWQAYTRDYPNGRHWSASQNAIIDTEFQTGMDALADKKNDLARERFDAFLKAHPLDDRARRILYLYGAMNEARAGELETAKAAKPEIEAAYRLAIEEWAKLISKYPRTQEANTALFRTGIIQEEKLGDFEKALVTYRTLVTESGYGEAAPRLAQLSQKTLTLATERAFRTNEKPVARIKTRNIEKVTVRLYNLDLQSYFRKMHRIGSVEALDVSLIQPDKTWDVPVAGYAKYKPLEQDIEIPFEDNTPGARVVTVGTDDQESTVLVLRSDLETVVKSSRREVLAFVQDMLTGKPAEGAEVLISDGAAVAATGKTGPDGVFTATFDSLKNLGDIRVFALRKGNVAAHNLDLSGLSLSTGLTPKGFLYTDRPAYLPGETVNLRGILREIRSDAYAVPENSAFKVSFTDPQGRMLSEQDVVLSKFGTFNATLTLPPAAPVGAYTMAAYQDRKGKAPLRFTGSFEVRQFKLEKIRLTMEFPRRVYFRGEPVEGTIKAAFYWGEPVADRLLRYSLPDGRSFTAATDATGLLKFTFNTTSIRPGSALPFSATLDGENVAVAETLTLARLGFTVTATPSQPVILAGEPVDVAISTAGADGKPLAQSLTVAVLRLETPKPAAILSMLPWMGGPAPVVTENRVDERKAQTDAAGKTRLSLQLNQGGNYRVRVSGVDRFGSPVTTECTLEVSGDEDATKLRLFAETAVLKVGTDANVKLHSRLERGLALVTYEGEALLRRQIVELKQGYNEIPFKVGHDLFPNFRLASVAIDGHELRTAFKEFTVERELKVSVKPLKAAYLPGEQGKVEVSVTDQTGKPVEAEFSLALVNEALYAVCPDHTTPILDFFQAAARRNAEFHVGASCGFRYDGTTHQIAKEIQDEASRVVRARNEERQMANVRDDLRRSVLFAGAPVAASMPACEEAKKCVDGDTGKGEGAFLDMVGEAPGNSPVGMVSSLSARRAFGGRRVAMSAFGAGESVASAPRREVRGEGRWLPSIVTDASGKAVVTMPMPETTTEWRLTARGCTPETLVGEATAQTLTRKDFFVELKVPSFVREGDSIRVVGRLHNLTDFAGSVKLVLTARDGKSPSALVREKTVEVKPNAGAETIFDAFAITNTLSLALELAAEAGTNRDVLAQEIPVKPWGLEYAAHAGGVASADTAVVIGLATNRTYSSAWMTVSVGPDIKTSVLDMALQNYWFGPCDAVARLCPPVWGEHPANQLLAVASALAYANQGKVDDSYRRKLADRARALVAALVSTQDGNGTWNATALGHLTTARAFWALVAARNAGIAVDAGAIDRAAAALKQQFQGCDVGDADTKAVLLHALSTDKRAEYANCNRLYRDRNSLGNAALAYIAHAFLNLDRKEIAAELAGQLEAKASVTPDRPMVCWESGCKMSWMNDTDETTALVLLALAQTKPDSKVAEAAGQYLLKSHGCFGFGNARARGPAVAALAAWFGKGREQATDMEIDVLVNGKAVTTIKAEGSQGLKVVPVPEGVVKGDKNLVEFKMKGRGRFAYSATLYGFSPDITAREDWNQPRVRYCNLLHSQVEYRGRPIGVDSTSPVKNLENGQRVVVRLGDGHGYNWSGRRFVLDVPLPAGARLVEGSLRIHNNNPYEIGEHFIRIHFDDYWHQASFELTGYVPGAFRMLPAVVREVGAPGFMTIGPTVDLTVLGIGEKSPDPYTLNDPERFALGQCYFNDGDYAAALEHLSALYKSNRQYSEAELARMLLWIYTTPEYYNARKVVEFFEVLRERYPQLEIPFDRILTVGKAYSDMGEFERAWLVYRAAISAGFANDSSISATLEDEGRFLGSVDFQERIWREYPDTAEVVSSYLALSQLLYQKAPTAYQLPKENGVQPEKVAMLKRAAEMLGRFLALYPKDPLDDQAGFSLANAMLDLKDYPRAVILSKAFAARYPDSPLVPSFQYMTALGLFRMNQYAEALGAARVVADGDSKDRDFARYILGQVYHAEGKPADAIQWYGTVRTVYPDAAEAIAYFEEKRIALDEVAVFRPGEAVVLPIKYRNIKEAFLQVYRVDLMKLYLQQKNLSKITGIQLAGIRPELEQTIALGDGKDYVEKERRVTLKLKDEAAYLVICRGDDLFTSGMTLITPLKIEAQEEPASGRVRVNVLDTVKKGYRPDVHVKAIGSSDSEFRDGDTDLRGLFIADNLRGKATVIAREGQSRYAFFRGDQWLGAQINAPAPVQPAYKMEAQQLDFQGNLNTYNGMIQQSQTQSFNTFRKQRLNKGVQVKAAQ